MPTSCWLAGGAATPPSPRGEEGWDEGVRISRIGPNPLTPTLSPVGRGSPKGTADQCFNASRRSGMPYRLRGDYIASNAPAGLDPPALGCMLGQGSRQERWIDAMRAILLGLLMIASLPARAYDTE